MFEMNMKMKLNMGADTPSGALEPTPPSTFGYGPREHVDDTRQAQHGTMNDVPLDVNFNAVVAREQALTWNMLGKNYESNADRRNKIADAFMGKQMAGAVPGTP